jgi:hypothetical protein
LDRSYLLFFVMSTGQLFDLNPLERLERFDVRDNAISGPFPLNISSLPHLTYFNVGGNRLSGAFPSTRAPPSLISCVVMPNNFQALPSQDTMDDLQSLASRCLRHTPESGGDAISSSGGEAGKDRTGPAKSESGTSHHRAVVDPVQLTPPTAVSSPTLIIPEASEIPLPSGVTNTPISPGAPVPMPAPTSLPPHPGPTAVLPSTPVSAPAPPMASLYPDGAGLDGSGTDSGHENRITNASSLSFSTQASQAAYALMVVLGFIQLL